jgi:hypothetical protein
MKQYVVGNNCAANVRNVVAPFEILPEPDQLKGFIGCVFELGMKSLDFVFSPS